MLIYRARLRNTSTTLTSLMSGEQICLQVLPKLFWVNSSRHNKQQLVKFCESSAAGLGSGISLKDSCTLWDSTFSHSLASCLISVKILQQMFLWTRESIVNFVSDLDSESEICSLLLLMFHKCFCVLMSW